MIVAVACWYLLPPLIPPASIPAPGRAEYWRDVQPVVITAVVAVLLSLLGLWRRRVRAAG